MSEEQFDFEAARKSLILERVAHIFDLIPMTPPTQRVMLVAKGVVTACKSNDALRRHVQESGFIESLKHHAELRGSGESDLPAALRMSFEDGSHQREQVRV